MFEGLPVEGKKFMEKTRKGEKERERKNFILWGKEPFMIGVSRIKCGEEGEFGCIGCKERLYRGIVGWIKFMVNLW